MARAFPNPPFSLVRARRLARAVGATNSTLLASMVEEGLTIADTVWLSKQGMAPYVRHRLRHAGLLAHLSPDVATRLTLGYSLSAVHEAVQHEGVVANFLGTLAEAGVETVVLKGMAFAHTIYPAPHLRPKSDIDLWVARADIPLALERLQAQGFRLADTISLESVKQWEEGEIALTYGENHAYRVELQFPPMRGLWARSCSTIDPTTLWERATPITIEGQPARCLSSADALIHVAFHQAINHQFTYPCWLRSLLDVHLLVTEGAPEWNILLESAKTWQLQTVTWTVLSLAHTLLGTPVPDEVLAMLAPHPARQALIRHFDLERTVLEAHPADYRLRRYGVQLALTDNPLDSARLMGRAIFPESKWLRARYPDQQKNALPLHHWRRLVTSNKG
jgi:hypothetical protein